MKATISGDKNIELESDSTDENKQVINHKITSNYESEYEVVDLKEDYSLVDDKEELIKSENRRRKIHLKLIQMGIKLKLILKSLMIFMFTALSAIKPLQLIILVGQQLKNIINQNHM